MKKVLLFLMIVIIYSCDGGDNAGEKEGLKKVKSITLEDSSLEFEFDEEGNLIKFRDESYTYNEKGNLIKSYNSRSGFSLAFEYDDLERLTRINSVSNNGENFELSNVNYYNNYIKLDGIDVTTIAFLDSSKKIVKSISYYMPVGSTSGKRYASDPQVFSYDDLGNLIKIDFYSSSENNGFFENINEVPDEIRTTFELEYDKSKINVFDLIKTMKGRTGQFDLSSLITTSTLSAGPIDRMSMFSKSELLYDPVFESKERVYTYSTEGVLEAVQIFSLGNPRGNGLKYLIEYY